MDTLSLLTTGDITKELGISIATVSRTLRDSPGISKEQRGKIQARAHEHNFYPNVIAELLCNSKVKPLGVTGVIISQLLHFYFFNIPSGIGEEVSVRGYHIMVAQSNEKYDHEVRICRDYFENKVCGVIVLQVKDAICYEHFQKLTNHGMPLAFYDRIRAGVKYSRAVVDDYMGAFNAAAYLIQTGYRRIAYYGMLVTMEISKNRYNGYRDAVIKYGLKVNGRFLRTCNNRTDAEPITPELLSQEEAPDAFFAVNDDMTVSILYAIEHIGCRVPEDIPIYGFTNGNRAKACDPMPIIIEQRGMWVGEEAANILIPCVEGFILPNKAEKRIMKTKLITRGTTR